MARDLTYRTSRHSLVLVSVYILVIFILSLSFHFSFNCLQRTPPVHPLAEVPSPCVCSFILYYTQRHAIFYRAFVLATNFFCY